MSVLPCGVEGLHNGMWHAGDGFDSDKACCLQPAEMPLVNTHGGPFCLIYDKNPTMEGEGGPQQRGRQITTKYTPLNHQEGCTGCSAGGGGGGGGARGGRGPYVSPVNVFLGVIRGVILDDPVHGRNIQATSCDICAEQDARLSLAELEEGGRALLLLLLAVDVLHRDVHVVEQLRVELHAAAG